MSAIKLQTLMRWPMLRPYAFLTPALRSPSPDSKAPISLPDERKIGGAEGGEREIKHFQQDCKLGKMKSMPYR